jgi:ankyrin repeat protein, putative
LEAVDEVGDTPLTYACMGNSFDGVKYLVEKGALINTEHNNRSPIQIACGKSDMNIIEYLLDHGADLSVGSNSEIGTPLHWAAGENRVEVAQLLLERGANVDALNAPGLTPLILATANTCAPMVQLLLSHNADPKVVLRERPYQ